MVAGNAGIEISIDNKNSSAKTTGNGRKNARVCIGVDFSSQCASGPVAGEGCPFRSRPRSRKAILWQTSHQTPVEHPILGRRDSEA